MSLSLLPTDSLYKFGALVGLTGLFALVFVLPYTVASRFQEKHFKALREQAAFEAQSKGLDDIIQILNQIIEAQANQKASEDNLPLDYSQDEINGKVKELAERRMNAAISKAQIEVLVKEMEEIDRATAAVPHTVDCGRLCFHCDDDSGSSKMAKDSIAGRRAVRNRACRF